VLTVIVWEAISVRHFGQRQAVLVKYNNSKPSVQAVAQAIAATRKLESFRKETDLGSTSYQGGGYSLRVPGYP
jgi:hypothetical protein